MDTKKLRQKILDLAIRGKLVPQDPNDEPASVLLERIRAEKQQLIKEGKIKAPKGSKACDTSHYEKIEGPFEIPESWEWVRLGDICHFENGYAFSSHDYRSQGTPLIRISNLHKISRFYARLNKNQDHILSLLASGHRLPARRKVL